MDPIGQTIGDHEIVALKMRQPGSTRDHDRARFDAVYAQASETRRLSAPHRGLHQVPGQPIRSTEIVETSKHLSRAPLNGSRARAVRSGFVVQSGANGCRFDYLDSRTSRPITSTTLALPSAGNVYERVWSWTVTPDGRKLLVLTAGGFKEQAYLRVYALPSLARLGDIPLLEILDDSPVALLLDEP